ncbi:hypothetical protein [Mycolicibacter sinensis]
MTNESADATLTALALIEQHQAGDHSHVPVLLADADHLQTIRILASAVSVARCLAEDLAREMNAPVDDILAAARETFTPKGN